MNEVLHESFEVQIYFVGVWWNLKDQIPGIDEAKAEAIRFSGGSPIRIIRHADEVVGLITPASLLPITP